MLHRDNIFNARSSFEETHDFIETNFELDLRKLTSDQTKATELERAHEQRTKIQTEEIARSSENESWTTTKGSQDIWA